MYREYNLWGPAFFYPTTTTKTPPKKSPRTINQRTCRVAHHGTAARHDTRGGGSQRIRPECAPVDPHLKSIAAAERSTISLQQRNDAAPATATLRCSTQRCCNGWLRRSWPSIRIQQNSAKYGYKTHPSYVAAVPRSGSDLLCVPCPGPHDPQDRRSLSRPRKQRRHVTALPRCRAVAMRQLLGAAQCWTGSVKSAVHLCVVHAFVDAPPSLF